MSDMSNAGPAFGDGRLDGEQPDDGALSVTDRREPDGLAVVWCEGAFTTTYGKTAHGLVRRTERYRVVAVIDSDCAGHDAGEVLDGRANGIPLVESLDRALEMGRGSGSAPSHLVIGLAPDGGRLPDEGREVVKRALAAGLNVDSGLHDFLSDDTELASLAAQHGVVIRDVRKPPPRSELHFFSGKIAEIDSLTIACLGTDSAIGKRTTAIALIDGLQRAGISTEVIGTGQTAWMQGVRYGLVLDSLVNDFVSGEIEHAVWTAWNEARPDVILLEGQGSLMNPAYPGGFELLAAGRPDVVLLQHAPARTAYDGFPEYPLHPLKDQIHAIEFLSGKPVVAVTISHEGLDAAGVRREAAAITAETGLPACDVLLDGPDVIVELVKGLLAAKDRR